MRRVRCRVCREWCDFKESWLCSEECLWISKRTEEENTNRLREIEDERKKNVENTRRAREASIVIRKTKAQNKRDIQIAKSLEKLKAKEAIAPNGDRRKHMERLIQRRTRIVVLEERLAKKTEQVRALKQEKKPNGFYETRQWQELRYRVLRHYGRQCMLCGSVGGELHVDHIKPRSLYPNLELTFDNLQILCRPCNMGKSNKDDKDWRPGA